MSSCRPTNALLCTRVWRKLNWVKIRTFTTRLDSLAVSDYYGLENHGALCYLNSVLQVLFMTNTFREAVKSQSLQDSIFIDAHLGRLFSDLEKRTVVDTLDITRFLGITEIYDQRDAAEYFEKILTMTRPEVSQVFKGSLTHRVICSSCQGSSKTEALFWTLPLSFQPRLQHYSVNTGFERLFISSNITGDDKIYCNVCKRKRDATVKCSMNCHPEILTLLLKRFWFDNKRMCFVKLACSVDMPRTLQAKGCTYELYAHVNHHGSLTGGHYTARIKSCDTGAWYDFDDDRVSLVSVERGS